MTLELSKSKREVNYYYSKEGSSFGPLNIVQLLEKIDGETMVYREGIEWTNAKNVEELKKYFNKVDSDKVNKKINLEDKKDKSITDDQVKANKKEDLTSASMPSKNRKPLIITLGVIILVATVTLLSIGVFKFKEEVDLFRKLDGELQVFVNNLILRQYPDSKSTKIETFPMGTRLILDENEIPKTDDKNRTWRKVRVIHPLYGWDKPDERFPYPYEGWMAIEECGVAWLGDSLNTAKLSRILGNEDASKYVTSNYRHSLLKYFEKMGYFDEWVIYGTDKKEDLLLVTLNKFGNSAKDCNNKDIYDFIAILHNKLSNDKKLLILSLSDDSKYKVVCDETIKLSSSYGELQGLRKLTSSEKRKLNKNYNSNILNPIMMVYDYKKLIIGIKYGMLSTLIWNE